MDIFRDLIDNKRPTPRFINHKINYYIGNKFVIYMNAVGNVNGRRQAYKQSFLSSLAPLEFVDGGGETDVYRALGDDVVYKVFRRDKSVIWEAQGEPTAKERADNAVRASNTFFPDTDRISEDIVKQPYIAGVNDAQLKTALASGDKYQAREILEGLQRYHRAGLGYKDAKIENLLNPNQVGVLSVDNNGWYKPRTPEDYLDDPTTLGIDATNWGYSDGIFQAIGDVYGSSVVKVVERRVSDFLEVKPKA